VNPWAERFEITHELEEPADSMVTSILAEGSRLSIATGNEFCVLIVTEYCRVVDVLTYLPEAMGIVTTVNGCVDMDVMRPSLPTVMRGTCVESPYVPGETPVDLRCREAIDESFIPSLTVEEF
jgi:hypothetical protein